MKEFFELLINWFITAFLVACRIFLMFFMIVLMLDIIKGDLNDDEMTGGFVVACCIEIYLLISWVLKTYLNS